MKCPVFYEGKEVGWVQVQQESHGTKWDAVCRVDTSGVLRLYGMKDGSDPLRIGVLEPASDTDGVFRLCRAFSRIQLQAAGYNTPPESYILTENARMNIHTGDAKLDALIDAGQATYCISSGSLSVSVPFEPGKACPMAFALTGCTIQNGQAVLHGNKMGRFKIDIE